MREMNVSFKWFYYLDYYGDFGYETSREAKGGRKPYPSGAGGI